MRAGDPQDRGALSAAAAVSAVQPQPTTRVALSGTSPVVSAGLRTVLANRDAISVVARGSRADVVIVDLSVARVGAPVLPELGVPVVALAQPDEIGHLRSLDVHAVPHTCGGEELAAAVAAARAAGRAPTPTRSDGVGAPRHADLIAPLSARERLIVDGICRGRSNNELAAAMFISINTVKTNIRSAYRKIGVERRPQAIVWGLAHGYGRSPEAD